jgi:short subunit dehydrogenase-like uncharacterized protein
MERSGISMLLAGRSEASLQRLAAEFEGEYPTKVARHDDPDALRDLASSVTVLVSTAGPFTQVGELVVAAAVDAGTHYLDSTGEIEFMALTHRRHHQGAQEKGIVVMNACAFEYVLGDCATEIALRDAKDARAVRVSYCLPDKTMTHGTALTALRAVSSGELGRVGLRAQRVQFPEPVGERWAVTYPGGELELTPRQHPDVAVTTLMDMPPLMARSTGVMPVLSSALRLPGVRGLVERGIQRLPAGPPQEKRAKQEFTILVEVDPAVGRRSGVVVRGVDPYGVTGEILARTAARLARGEHNAVGVLTPSQAFDPEDTLNSLADLGVSWERLS